jgi:trehalose utilization protein
VRTTTLDEPEHGLTDAMLDATDTLVWWGHKAHEEVAESVVERVHERVLGGMGLVALHSAHYSKIFRRLMGTTCTVNWRVAAEREAPVGRRTRAPDRRGDRRAHRPRPRGDVRRGVRHPGPG